MGLVIDPTAITFMSLSLFKLHCEFDEDRSSLHGANGVLS
jgi:hypothetical protein